MTKPHFIALENLICKERLALPEEEDAKLDIEWMWFRNNGGIVAALDKHTQQWVRSIATHLIYEGVNTHVQARWEHASAWECRGYLTGIRWKSQSRNVRLNEFLALNRLEGQFNITTWSPGPNGVWVSFEPKEPLLTKLRKKSRLSSGCGTFYPKWHYRRCLSEEEYLDRANKGKNVPKISGQ